MSGRRPGAEDFVHVRPPHDGSWAWGEVRDPETGRTTRVVARLVGSSGPDPAPPRAPSPPAALAIAAWVDRDERKRLDAAVRAGRRWRSFVEGLDEAGLLGLAAAALNELDRRS